MFAWYPQIWKLNVFCIKRETKIPFQHKFHLQVKSHLKLSIWLLVFQTINFGKSLCCPRKSMFFCICHVDFLPSHNLILFLRLWFAWNNIKIELFKIFWKRLGFLDVAEQMHHAFLLGYICQRIASLSTKIFRVLIENIQALA